MVADTVEDTAVGAADSTEGIVEHSMAAEAVAPAYDFSEGMAFTGLLLPSDGTE